MMFTLIQVVVDVIFALALIVLAGAHFSGRSFHSEFDIFRDAVEHWVEKIEAKIDGGAIRK